METEEKWAWVPGYEDMFKVSNTGRVLSVPRLDTCGRRVTGGIRKTPVSKAGYPACSLNKDGKLKLVYVHSMVAWAFLGPQPAGYYINHISGVKTDNRLVNLEYVTPLGNAEHANRTGLIKRNKGSQVWSARLTEEDVLSIRALRASGFRLHALASRFGVAYNTICAIVYRQKWTHI